LIKDTLPFITMESGKLKLHKMVMSSLSFAH